LKLEDVGQHLPVACGSPRRRAEERIETFEK